MYEIFIELLTLAEKVGDIKGVRFQEAHNEYTGRGTTITGITSGGEEFTIKLTYEKKAATDANE